MVLDRCESVSGAVASALLSAPDEPACLAQSFSQLSFQPRVLNGVKAEAQAVEQPQCGAIGPC
jgi:hypothetical protein